MQFERPSASKRDDIVGIISITLTYILTVITSRTPRHQVFTVRQTISALSQGTTLEPGSIIMTGTPKGVGFVRKPPVYLKDGDNVKTWIGGGIGTLVNSVVEEGPGAKL